MKRYLYAGILGLLLGICAFILYLFLQVNGVVP